MQPRRSGARTLGAADGSSSPTRGHELETRWPLPSEEQGNCEFIKMRCAENRVDNLVYNI